MRRTPNLSSFAVRSASNIWAAAWLGLAAALTACGSSSFTSTTAKETEDPADAVANAVSSADASGTAGKPGSTSGNGSGTTGSTGKGSGTGGNGSGTVATVIPPPPPNINFGMLVTDLNCTFCHLEVHGSVASIGDVPALRSDSHGEVFGNWLVGGAYDATAALSTPPVDGGIMVSGTVTPHYANTGKELPVAASGAPAFPLLDFSVLSTKMQGTVKSASALSTVASITKVYKGNAVLVGTQAQPITISGDVLIEGDVILKGYYTGVGTIYATGNVYIPANVKALHLASLPYSDTAATADKQAVADLKAGSKDALGIATAKSVFIGDLENYTDAANGTPPVPAGAHGVRYGSLYNATTTDPLYYTNSGVWNVYSWYPELQYEQLYETTTPCWTAASGRALVAGHNWGERTFNEIDAYFYAEQTITGVDRAANWTINGGMIAQTMHIVSGAGSDSVGANAVCPAARINFDYRMRNGLQILEALAPLFPDRS